jgi:hypothetical protein
MRHDEHKQTDWRSAGCCCKRYVYKEHTKGDGGIIIYHPYELININFRRPL